MVYVTLAIFLLTGSGIVILLGLGDSLMNPRSARGSPDLMMIFASIIILNGAIIAATGIILVRLRGLSWDQLGFVRPQLRWILGSIALGLVLVATIEGIERTFELSAGELTTWLIAPDGFSLFGLLGGLVLIGFLAPFGEELYFRGLIYRWLRDKWGIAAATPLSALLFAGTHFYYPVPLMLLVAFLGVVLAIAYERSGTLWAPISIHATQNSTVVLLIYGALA